MATTVDRLLRFAVAGLSEGEAVHAAEPPQIHPATDGVDKHPRPTGSATPERPTQHVEFSHPVEFSKPIDFSQSVKPSQPVESSQPVEHAPPVELPQREEVAEPEVAVVSDESIQPDEPVQPDEPMKKRKRKSDADSPQVFFNF